MVRFGRFGDLIGVIEVSSSFVKFLVSEMFDQALGQGQKSFVYNLIKTHSGLRYQEPRDFNMSRDFHWKN
jgi:hypothetical protein